MTGKGLAGALSPTTGKASGVPGVGPLAQPVRPLDAVAVLGMLCRVWRALLNDQGKQGDNRAAVVASLFQRDLLESLLQLANDARLVVVPVVSCGGDAI